MSLSSLTCAILRWWSTCFPASACRVEQFGIDGLRLDVAYCLDHNFLRQLRSFCDSLKEEFFLVGEVLFGDYNQIMNPQMLHSCTNYECYKGLAFQF